MTDSDFTISGYAEMLMDLRGAGYETVTYSTAVTDGAIGPKLLLRHDVDFALEYLTAIAEVDRECGFSSTFFIQSRSPLYNPLSVDARRVFDRLHQLGHRIGLHHDPEVGTDLASIELELRVLETAGLLSETSTFSLHRPGSMSNDLADLRYAPSLHHAHEGELAKFVYFSDSACRWRNGPPQHSEAFERRVPIQILTHPLWWLVNGADGTEKLRSFATLVEDRTLDRLQRTAVSFKLLT